MKVPEVYDLFDKIVEPFNLIASLYYAYPLTVLIESKNVDTIRFSQYFHNNEIYPTLLMNPIYDMSNITGRVNDMMNPMINSITNFFKHDSIEMLFEKHFNAQIVLKNYSYSEKISFISDVLLFISQFQNICKMSKKDIINTFNSTDSTLLSSSFVDLILFIIKFIDGYTENMPPLIIKESQETTDIIFSFLIICLFIAISIICVGFFLLYGSYTRLFQILFLLPKNEVSTLIQKLGKKKLSNMSTVKIDAIIKNNLNQLTVQAPPHTFLTFFEITFRIITLSVLLCVIFLAISYPYLHLMKNFITTSMKNLENSNNVLILPLYYFMIGSDIAQIVITDRFNFKPNMRNMLLKDAYNLTSTSFYERLPELTSDEKYPNFIPRSVFLDANTCNESKVYSLCLSQLGIAISGLTYSFEFINTLIDNQTIDDIQMINTIGFLMTSLTLTVPNMLHSIMDAFNNHSTTYVFTGAFIVFLHLFLTVFLIYATSYAVRNISNHSDFSKSIMSSVPSNVANDCYDALKELLKKNKKGIKTDDKPLEYLDILPAISDYLLLVDQYNNIIESTPSTSSVLLFDPIGMNMQTLIDRISLNDHYIQLPPVEETTLLLDVKVPNVNFHDSIDLLFKIIFMPLKRFEYNNIPISYACIIDDVTQHELLVMEMNNEANRVRILMTQFVPWQVASTLLTSDNFKTVIISKVITATFMIGNFDQLDIQEIKEIKQIIRLKLYSHPHLTFVGRSIQMFRVMNGMFDTNNIGYDDVMELINFSIELICHLNNEFPNLEVRNGVHITGPFFAAVIADLPPTFDIFGNTMSIGSLIAINSPPNQVNVSRQVYIEIIDNGFSVELVSEITRLNGKIVSVYKIVSI